MKDRFNRFAKYHDFYMKLLGLYMPKEIAETLDLTGKEKILDLGGGTGYIANFLSKKCKKIVVLDTSREMLAVAKKYDALDLCMGKADNLPFPNNFFDIILCVDVIHHLQNKNGALKEIKRILKPNGRVLVLEYDRESLKGKLLLLIEKIISKRVDFMAPHELKKLFSVHGFSGNTKKISSFQYFYKGIKK